MVWLGSLFKKALLMLGFSKAPFLDLLLFCCAMMIFLSVIGNLVINADGTNLYSKWDQASVVWQQFELTSGLKSNLSSTVVEVGWGRLVVLKWLFTNEIQLVSVGCSSKSGVDVKMNGCLTLKVLFEEAESFFLLLEFFSLCQNYLLENRCIGAFGEDSFLQGCALTLIPPGILFPWLGWYS